MCSGQSCLLFRSFRCALQGPDLEPVLYLHSVDPMFPDSLSFSVFLAFRSSPVLYTWMFLVEQEGTSDSIRGLRRQ